MERYNEKVTVLTNALHYAIAHGDITSTNDVPFPRRLELGTRLEGYVPYQILKDQCIDVVARCHERDLHLKRADLEHKLEQMGILWYKDKYLLGLLIGEDIETSVQILEDAYKRIRHHKKNSSRSHNTYV